MSLSAPSSSVPKAPRTIPVALFAVALLLVAGAAIAVTAAYFELRSPSTPPGAITITDDVGRTVAVPPNPHRVVVLAPSTMDSMVRLGLRDRVVGIDCGTTLSGGISQDYNDSQVSAWGLTNSMCVETAPSVNLPQLLNASPELVLASTIVSIADVEEMSVTYSIPVVMLQPSTLGGIAVDVTLLGEIFGVGPAASTLVGQLQAVLGTAQQLVTNLSFTGAPLPTLLLTYYASPDGSPAPGYWTYGPGTFGRSLIEFVGAASIAASSALPYFEMSGSQVLSAQPWAVIYGVGFGVTLATYQQGPEWSSLTAVQDGRAWGIDSNLLTEPDPTMVLSGLPVLLALLHPDVYPPR